MNNSSQTRPYWKQPIFWVAVVVISVALGVYNANQNNPSIGTDHVELKSFHLNAMDGASTVEGEATIKSKCALVKIEFRLFDENDKVLSNALGLNENMRSGDSWRFEAVATHAGRAVRAELAHKSCEN